MTSADLAQMIESLIIGDISETDHERLQTLLKANPEARAIFRERMDLEASLRTWALEEPTDIGSPAEIAPVAFPSDGSEQETQPTSLGVPYLTRIAIVAVTVAAALLVLFGPWFQAGDPETPQLAVEDTPSGRNQAASSQFIGSIREQADCQWENADGIVAGRFPAGRFSLITGVAELSFDSGTDVVLEAPCDFEVASVDTARLLAGNVFVNVTEVSNGFVLETPEAQIVDEGTEYAVALNDSSTEVHVFDGSVFWIPEVEGTDFEDRIAAGEAKSYSHDEPTVPKRIPFGKRQFVRRIEADVQSQSGAALLAYDGFENLAGHLRRGRSGFGWSTGWESGGRGRGKLATIVETPADVVFGMNRSGRRQIMVSEGEDIRREFDQPLTWTPGEDWFVSFLLERRPSAAGAEQSIQIALEPESGRGRHRRRQFVSFGVNSDGFPFVNSGSAIEQTASLINEEEVCFWVAKISVTEQGMAPMVRIYRPDESVDEIEPSVWTVAGSLGRALPNAQALGISAGKDAVWQIDELKVGRSWHSVTNVRQAE